MLLRQAGSELAAELLHLLEDDFMGQQLQQAQQAGDDGLRLQLLVSDRGLAAVLSKAT